MFILRQLSQCKSLFQTFYLTSKWDELKCPVINYKDIFLSRPESEILWCFQIRDLSFKFPSLPITININHFRLKKTFLLFKLFKLDTT